MINLFNSDLGKWGFISVGVGVVIFFVRSIFKKAILYKVAKKDLSESKIQLQRHREMLSAQLKREENHDKRVEEILSGTFDSSDISRMLSTYPDENKATKAAIVKGSEN